MKKKTDKKLFLLSDFEHDMYQVSYDSWLLASSIMGFETRMDAYLSGYRAALIQLRDKEIIKGSDLKELNESNNSGTPR